MANKKKQRRTLSPEERLFLPHLRTWYADHPEYEANRAAFIRKRLPIDIPILRGLWERQGGKSAIGGRAISLNKGVTNAYSVLATPRHIPVRASIDHKKPRHLYRSGQVPLEEIYDLEKNGQWISTFQNQHKNGFNQEELEREAAESRKYHELMSQVAEGAKEYQEHSRHFSRKALRLKLAATLAASANTDEGLSFESALNQMRSANQKAFKEIISKASHALGLKPHLEDAIGDWTDGAEHSVLQRIHEPIDERTSEYLAAWYGLLANQKSVLVFHPKHQGPDSTYEIDLPDTDLAKVRESLNQAGIPFRTIVPTRKGTKVVVYDEGRQLRNNVAQFGEANNADIRESQGQGRFIGGSSRTQARSKYRRIITAYEARTGHSAAGRYAHTQAGPIPSSIPSVRDNYQRSEPTPPAKPQIPQQEPARMSKGLMGKFRSKWEGIKESLRRASPESTRSRKWAERDRRAKELQGKVKESRVQAPVGGMIVRGIYYPGGRMIPSKNYSEDQKARYQRGDFAGALQAEADHKARVRYAAEKPLDTSRDPVDTVAGPNQRPPASASAPYKVAYPPTVNRAAGVNGTQPTHPVANDPTSLSRRFPQRPLAQAPVQPLPPSDPYRPGVTFNGGDTLSRSETRERMSPAYDEKLRPESRPLRQKQRELMDQEQDYIDRMAAINARKRQQDRDRRIADAENRLKMRDEAAKQLRDIQNESMRADLDETERRASQRYKTRPGQTEQELLPNPGGQPNSNQRPVYPDATPQKAEGSIPESRSTLPRGNKQGDRFGPPDTILPPNAKGLGVVAPRKQDPYNPPPYDNRPLTPQQKEYLEGQSPDTRETLEEMRGRSPVRPPSQRGLEQYPLSAEALEGRRRLWQFTYDRERRKPGWRFASPMDLTWHVNRLHGFGPDGKEVGLIKR